MQWPEEVLLRDASREFRGLVRASSCSEKLLVESSWLRMAFLYSIENFHLFLDAHYWECFIDGVYD